MATEDNGATTVLSELTIRNQQGDQTQILTLRLTPRSLILVPDAPTLAYYEKYLVHDQQGLEHGHGIMGWLLSQILQAGARGVTEVTAPHPLQDTDIRLDSSNLHLRLGRGDADYPAAAFDSVQAGLFVERYLTAKAAL